MKPNDIDRLIKHLDAQPSRDLDQRIDVLLNSQPTALPAGRWKRAGRSRVAKFAVAAAVLLALAVGIPFFNGDHSRLWAQVLENTNNLSNYTFRHAAGQEAPGLPEVQTMVVDDKYYVSEGYVAMVETYVEGRLDHRSYYPRDGKEVIAVYPATKEYERRPGVPSRRRTAGDMTKWLLTGEYVELGKKTVDGRVLAGLASRRVPDRQPKGIEDYRTEAWFDMETKLLAVWQTTWKDKNSDRLCMNRRDQFQYGLEFPPHLFEPQIPQDYTPTVVDGLRLFAELTGGQYPRSPDPSAIQSQIGDRAQVESAIQAAAPPSGKYGYDGLMRALAFLFEVARGDGDSGYYAYRVSAKDANRVLAYWKCSGPDYEVVWGDLRLETLSKDHLLQRCCAAGDAGCLWDFLEKDDGTRTLVLAEYLGQIGDRSVVPALLGHMDRWQGLPAGNPFPRAIEAIRQRQEQQNPTSALLLGRLLYANGRPVTNGLIRIAAQAGSSDRNGYFALMVPCSAPQAEQLGYARQAAGTSACLFLWKKPDPGRYPIIVLEWVSSVRGRVVNQQGQPQSYISVGLSSHPGGEAGRFWPDGTRTATDAQGCFVFEKVPVGAPLEVVVADPNIVGSTVRVQIDNLVSDQKYEMGDVVLSR